MAATERKELNSSRKKEKGLEKEDEEGDMLIQLAATNRLHYQICGNRNYRIFAFF